MGSIAFKATIIRCLSARLISAPLSSQETRNLVQHFECMQAFDRSSVYAIMFSALIWISLRGSRAVVFRLPFISAFIGLVALHRKDPWYA